MQTLKEGQKLSHILEERLENLRKKKKSFKMQMSVIFVKIKIK
jgi:hypothetical protein